MCLAHYFHNLLISYSNNYEITLSNLYICLCARHTAKIRCSRHFQSENWKLVLSPQVPTPSACVYVLYICVLPWFIMRFNYIDLLFWHVKNNNHIDSTVLIIKLKKGICAWFYRIRKLYFFRQARPWMEIYFLYISCIRLITRSKWIRAIKSFKVLCTIFA